MRLIFLDIDGVLNDHQKLPGSLYCGICVQRVGRLNRILEAVPDAQLVISSSWRYMILKGEMTLKGFEMLLLLNGVHCQGRLYGHTCADGDLCEEPDHADVQKWREIGIAVRTQQIQLFVEEHKPERYVVLDDLPLYGLQNFVMTDGNVGLTDEDAERTIHILRATTITPTVVVDGREYAPEGWMWVLAFALRGCEWALLEANKPEFKDHVRQRLRYDEQARQKAEAMLVEAEHLKSELRYGY